MFIGRILAFVVGIAMIAIAGWYFVDSLKHVGTAFASRNWTKTDAVITKVTERVHKNRKGPASIQFSVDYAYTVNGMKYSANWTSLNSKFNHSGKSGFKEGKPAVAYYKPSDPSQSRLFNYVGVQDITPILAEIFFIGLGVSFLNRSLFTSNSEPDAWQKRSFMYFSG